MKLLFKTSALLALALTSQNTWAWGSTGHQSIALIAEQHMTPNALKKAHALLDGDSLMAVSMWADLVRSNPKTYGNTGNWHYTTWPDDAEHFTAKLETPQSGFLLSQIEKQSRVLIDIKSSPAKKAFALKFLVHLVGDLHQPLHVGGGHDRGGNDCKVIWLSNTTNLHAVWDSALIDSTQLDYIELAALASQDRSKKQIAQWQASQVLDWAKESKQLSPSIYPAEVNKSKAPSKVLSYCQANVLQANMPILDADCTTQNLPTVNQRVFQAGIRLANLLNKLLDADNSLQK